ncbi:hypothetical protein SAMN02745181_0372 [Rubritalea squalenifaciens DSM 18772]|uniref:Uncharacterized protein n=1 Tax=Rubritalea squalenifaciens DSM 18772 TaxID=1123071 RepID=A0A1M6C397_9BACT|nr:hypothetical protein [Rubritalea squalenifaciens]SHI55291.1 hypothetical protein SAMN02745181_0372 [Rubritalea squalenifaciens DSM 18772]
MNYYSFEIDGVKVGYFEYEDRDGILYQRACLAVNGERQEFPFWVKYLGTTISAYKSGNGDYVSLPGDSEAVPSSALMLFLDKICTGDDLRLPVINEGSGEISGEASFIREGDKIQVLLDGKPDKHFILQGGRIVEFGWGGQAVSRLMPSKEAAVTGTAWAE